MNKMDTKPQEIILNVRLRKCLFPEKRICLVSVLNTCFYNVFSDVSTPSDHQHFAHDCHWIQNKEEANEDYNYEMEWKVCGLCDTVLYRPG